MKPSWRALVLFVVLTLALAGCGKRSPSAADVPAPSPSDTASVTESPSPEPSPTVSPSSPSSPSVEPTYASPVPKATVAVVRVSVGQHGEQGDGSSFGSAISADGRFVAFMSIASNLVPGDTPNTIDFFLRDRGAKTTIGVSFGGPGPHRGVQSMTPSAPAISGNGRYVAYWSQDNGLAPGDTDGGFNLLVFDRVARTTVVADVSSGGEMADTQGDGEVALSHDGRYVAFTSPASNLVPGDTNRCGEEGQKVPCRDAFVRDLVGRTTERVSIATDGTQSDQESMSPSISADGRYVVFQSSGAGLVPDDTNGAQDAFLRDRVAGTTQRVSVSAAGVEGNRLSGNPAISADGRFIAFESQATNLVAGGGGASSGVFLKDRVGGAVTRVSAPLPSFELGISADGGTISMNNMQGTVYLWSRAAGTARSVCLSFSGEPADGTCGGTVSADGKHLIVSSGASNIVPADTNRNADVFVYDL